MREFKFRVWSIEEKQFISPNILEVFDESGDLTAFKYIKTGKLNPLYMPVENYIIQQYTGLTDKNKNLIYEGDIVKFSRLFEKERKIKELKSFVRFDEGQFGFDLIGFNDMFFTLSDECGIEVIGNIFEHSELLKTI
jgi:uncharacterized phage protein (TIGR01671 family)